MIHPVYIRKSEFGLEGVEIYLTGIGQKIIAINERYKYLSIHKFRYKNKMSLLHKLNGPLLKLSLVDYSYSWGINFNGGLASVSYSSFNSSMYWSDFDTPEKREKPDLTVDTDFIRKLRLPAQDRLYIRTLFEKIVKKLPKNPSRESKDPFKYMSRYHGRKR